MSRLQHSIRQLCLNVLWTLKGIFAFTVLTYAIIPVINGVSYASEEEESQGHSCSGDCEDDECSC